MEVNIPLHHHEKDSVKNIGEILCHFCLDIPFLPHSFVYGAYNTFTKQITPVSWLVYGILRSA